MPAVTVHCLLFRLFLHLVPHATQKALKNAPQHSSLDHLDALDSLCEYWNRLLTDLERNVRFHQLLDKSLLLVSLGSSGTSNVLGALYDTMLEHGRTVLTHEEKLEYEL